MISYLYMLWNSHLVQEVLRFAGHCVMTDLKVLLLIGSAVAIGVVLKKAKKAEVLEPAELFLLRTLALVVLIVGVLLLFGITTI